MNKQDKKTEKKKDVAGRSPVLRSATFGAGESREISLGPAQLGDIFIA